MQCCRNRHTVQLLRKMLQIEVELAFTPDTLRTILHATIAKVDIRCNSAIPRIIARNVASSVRCVTLNELKVVVSATPLFLFISGDAIK